MGKLDLGKPAYMGRFFGFGLTTYNAPAFFYGAEGRSPPSRRRKFVVYGDEGVVRVDLNSETTMEHLISGGGIPDCLLYNAVRTDSSGLVVVSNGFHTDSDPVWNDTLPYEKQLVGVTPKKGIFNRLRENPQKTTDTIRDCLVNCGPERDPPVYTARIAAAGDVKKYPDRFVAGIIIDPRGFGGEPTHSSCYNGISSIRLQRGIFRLMAVYGVQNPPYFDALPPVLSRPDAVMKEIHLDGTSPDQLVEELWRALPEEILVGVAAGVADSDKPAGFQLKARSMRE